MGNMNTWNEVDRVNTETLRSLNRPVAKILQLQGWRANIDLKPILSTHVSLQYISKYASKSEPQSAAFSEI
jgi:hypothetical protein